MRNDVWEAFVETVVTILIIAIPVGVFILVIAYTGAFGLFAMAFCSLWALTYFINKAS